MIQPVCFEIGSFLFTLMWRDLYCMINDRLDGTSIKYHAYLQLWKQIQIQIKLYKV
jgi:hypothetical protein